MVPFAERLKAARKAKGFKQREAADYLQITPRSYQQYEGGVRRPSFESLAALAVYLDVTTDYLLGLSDTPQPTQGGNL